MEGGPLPLLASGPLHLFDAVGVELEYMIVDAATLSVRPLADRLLRDVAGQYAAEVEMGPLAWSNELALHVIELKTNGPAGSVEPLAGLFQQHVRQINELLRPYAARLMPSAMHPWMDPHRELRLWPHEYNPVYEAYHRIFDCRGHGWANLQSVHLNLPFADDREFGQLHAAMRLLMPLMPALTASSPIVQRRLTGLLDNRLDVYRTNARRIPSVTGAVIPESVYTRQDYEQQILQRMYADIRPLDPQGVLQYEWLNSRGAIARFDRHTIEIRVLDVQECPAADLAVVEAILFALRQLVDQRWSDLVSQQQMPTDALATLLRNVIRQADQTRVDNLTYLSQFGWTSGPCTASQLWRHLLTSQTADPDCGARFGQGPLETILQHGTLARRIARAVGPEAAPDRIERVYGRLCECLQEGRMFLHDH